MVSRTDAHATQQERWKPIKTRFYHSKLSFRFELVCSSEFPAFSVRAKLNMEEIKVPFKSWPKAKEVSERRTFFSEQRRSFQLPEYGTAQKPNAVAVNNDEQMVIGVQSPVGAFCCKNGQIQYVDLWESINQGRHGFQAKLNVAALPNGEFLIQERATNQMFVLRPEDQSVYRLCPSSGIVFGQYGYKRGEAMPGGFNDPKPARGVREFQMITDFSESKGIVFFYSSNNQFVHRLVFDTTEDAPDRPRMEQINLGLNPVHIQALSESELLVEDLNGEYSLVRLDTVRQKGTLSQVLNGHPISISPFPTASPDTITNITGDDSHSEMSSRCFISGWSASGVLLGAPDSQLGFSEVAYPRPVEVSGGTMSPPVWLSGSVCAQLVAPRRVPASIFTEQNPRPLGAGAFVELVDFNSKRLSYVPVPEVHQQGDFRWYNRADDYAIGACSQSGLVVTADGTGRIREFDSYRESIDTGLKEWQKMVGSGKNGTGPLRVEYERHSGEGMKKPKHGKEDPNNDPHVGGNTWAGGTGGRDTAGLGGKGGPYRLDKGHDVHQLSDEEKAEVPEHIRQAARQEADQALRDRLKEIKMSGHDHDDYHRIRGEITSDISSIKALVEGLQAKSKEREWLKNQTDGELDDDKLVEGLVGERLIYRRRREPENDDQGFDMKKPKRLTILADCSASMYRFNGTDGRLSRQLEALCMVMEGLDSPIAKEKIKWDMIGHSGDSRYIPLSLASNPPSNDKERYQILQQAASYPQFCFPGDYTIEATRESVRRLAADEEADERFLIVLTDANLDRYGIPVRSLRDSLDLDKSVNTCVIAIGSLGDQAQRMKEGLPAGRSFVVQDTSEIPKILRNLFQSTFLNV